MEMKKHQENLDADPNQISGKDSFNVFDEETGLIANQQQKNTLEKLSNNKAGPVIGFINMIINYLANCICTLYGFFNLRRLQPYFCRF